jgi:hypothetical protein
VGGGASRIGGEGLVKQPGKDNLQYRKADKIPYSQAAMMQHNEES